jgi:hypothetical protein
LIGVNRNEVLSIENVRSVVGGLLETNLSTLATNADQATESEESSCNGQDAARGFLGVHVYYLRIAVDNDFIILACALLVFSERLLKSRSKDLDLISFALASTRAALIFGSSNHVSGLNQSPHS